MQAPRGVQTYLMSDDHCYTRAEILKEAENIRDGYRTLLMMHVPEKEVMALATRLSPPKPRI